MRWNNFSLWFLLIQRECSRIYVAKNRPTSSHIINNVFLFIVDCFCCCTKLLCGWERGEKDHYRKANNNGLSPKEREINWESERERKIKNRSIRSVTWDWFSLPLSLSLDSDVGLFLWLVVLTWIMIQCHLSTMIVFFL